MLIEYIFLKISRASSRRPFNNRNRGLSGKKKIVIHARNAGKEQIARKILQDLISTKPFKRLQFHFCGIINHAMPCEKKKRDNSIIIIIVF